MPRPADTSRVLLEGHLNGGEIFQTGFALDASATSNANAADIAAAIASLLETHALTQLKGILFTGCGYDTVRVYGYPAGGAAPAAYQGEAPITGGAGTGGSGNGILQACLVCSLRTGIPGRRYRGRMYLPACGIVVAGGLTDPTATLAIATAMANFLGAVTGSVPIDANVAVVSAVGSTSTPVAGVIVDDRIDIQRRRADRLSPTESTYVPLAGG